MKFARIAIVAVAFALFACNGARETHASLGSAALVVAEPPRAEPTAAPPTAPEPVRAAGPPAAPKPAVIEASKKKTVARTVAMKAPVKASPKGELDDECSPSHDTCRRGLRCESRRVGPGCKGTETVYRCVED